MKWQLALVAAMATGHVFAQTPDAPEPTDVLPAPAAQPATTPEPACQALCAGQQIEVELAEPVGSDTHKIGDRFQLRLAAPLMRDGVVIVPAGTPGVGEVVHAQTSRAGGKPGELLLAARFLDLPDGPLPLRAMKLAARGKDNINASLGTSMVAGPFGLFVRGREIEIPAGTHAMAKLAQDLDPARAVHTSPVVAEATAPAQETPRTTDADNASHIKE
ncbi:hypothetical protein ACFW0P_16850 [Lysobacter soli]|uniref:hypothetical protein n=1 Tax=Lysobacter soli TaxID=453783 RepID=UPI00369683F8